MNYICPITLQTIKEYGINCFGNIYEYEAIEKWLEETNRDPVTNIIMPTKYIKKVSEHENIKNIADDIKKSTELWYGPLKFFNNAPIIWNKLKIIEENIKDIDKNKWVEYNNTKREMFLDEDNDAYYITCMGMDPDEKDPIKRPSGTGKGYQFIDLSNSKIEDKSFKSENFNFTNLENSYFVDCDFSRCEFIGTNLNNVHFINCRFIGEEICFYRAKGKNIEFNQCVFEYADRWEQTSDPKEIEGILEARLMEAYYNIY